MTALLPFPELQFCDIDGKPLVGGTVATYIPGTLTPKTTWQDAGQITANTNPIVLDAAGRCICYGAGTYRFIVSDVLGNLIYDQLTSSSLSESAVSAAMLPVIGAATIATADALLGIPDLIQTAISGISLLNGPTGPTGPAGPIGPTGTIGPTGSAGTILSAGNPGYWKDVVSGFIVQFGNSATGGSGISMISFPLAFPASCIAVVATATNSAGAWWCNTYSLSTTNFTITTSSPYVGGSWIGGPMSFSWIAVGF